MFPHSWASLRTLGARLERFHLWIPGKIRSGCHCIPALCPLASPRWHPGPLSGWALWSIPCLFRLRLGSGCWPSTLLELPRCRERFLPRCRDACRRNVRSEPGPPNLLSLHPRLPVLWEAFVSFRCDESQRNVLSTCHCIWTTWTRWAGGSAPLALVGSWPGALAPPKVYSWPVCFWGLSATGFPPVGFCVEGLWFGPLFPASSPWLICHYFWAPFRWLPPTIRANLRRG